MSFDERKTRQRLAKKKYYASEKGKAQKRREEAAYKASGGRAATDKRRGVSAARKAIRLRYQLMRRSSEKTLDELSRFVLDEAVLLRKMRETATGIKWHVDHIIPVSKGGTSHYCNIQVVPALWNRMKSNTNTNAFWRKGANK